MDKYYRKVGTHLIKFFTALASALLLVTSVAAESLQPFDANYKAYKYGRELGHASLSLQHISDDQYRMVYASKASLFLISDNRQELSNFRYIDSEIIPLTYQYRRTGTGSDKKLDATFIRANQRINIAGQEALAWEGEFDNQLYRLDLQLKLAGGEQEFEYDILNYRGEKRHYKLQVMGREQLELPYGMLEGIKVKILRDSNRRETFAWFSPALNYQLVRLQQFKDGEEQGDIRLSEFTLHNN